MGEFAFSLVTKHLKLTLLVASLAALALVIGLWRKALIAEGMAIQQVRHADSVLAVSKTALARIDTLFVHDTVRYTIARLRVDSLRDTLLLHKTDTTLVTQYVTRAESALAACTDVENSCAKYRLTAQQRFDAYEEKLKAQPVAVARSCLGSNVTTGVLTLVGVGLLDHFRRK